MRSVVRALVLLAVGVFSCSSEPDQTESALFEKSGGVYAYTRNVLIVIEPQLATAVAPRVVQLVEGMLLGQTDDEPKQDVAAPTLVWISVTTPEGARELVQERACVHAATDPTACPRANLQQLRYRWAPYGYADDLNRFLARVTCLLGASGAECPTDEPAADEAASMRDGFSVWLFTDRDACLGADCDPDVRALVQSVAAGISPDVSWDVTAFAGFPADLSQRIDGLDELTREAYLRQLVDELSVASGSDICGDRASVPARAAPALLHELVSVPGDGPMSLCAADYRPVLALNHCGGAVDFAGFSLDESEIARRADGLLDCSLYERLPASGAITRCAQLAPFGRDAVPVRVADGEESCRVQQLTEDEATKHAQMGWYLASNDGSVRAFPFTNPPMPLLPCTGNFPSVGPHVPALAPGTQTVPGSRLIFDCKLRKDGV